ncbi:DUF2867 domain-containing protein [uncultured Bacteroides sp.]|uniref:DUF2867 domain-containing protein n=1 Tax=uncultured Bacteroides sp. TaxID=162156 RepID=UPI0026760F1E|nr:DUF2867 domain-containing protein [uncultured Bacteroides sp.]
METGYVDYTDTYMETLQNARRMTAGDLFRLMFICYPKPILYLFRLRNWLVKPFGFQGGGGFAGLIKEKSEKEVVFGKSDKHLTFYVLLQCDTPDACTQRQSIRMTTFIKYHNSLGRVYFFFVRPFHVLICKRLLRWAVRNWENGNVGDLYRAT